MPSARLESLLSLTHVDVSYHGRLVGTIAHPAESVMTFFQYTDDWLRSGFPISPLSLPLERRVFSAPEGARDGLRGVFADCLPDDWGRLLVDRWLESEGVDAQVLSPLTRLALVGDRGLGALEFSPHMSPREASRGLDFDRLSQDCQRLIDSGKSEELDMLYRYGSSSGGARPKVMVDIDGEPWIVKFPTRMDGEGFGEEEYRYALAAQACQIHMAEVRLMPSGVCPGYFATRRFDRVVRADGRVDKIHMVSAAAMLEASPFDVVDYGDLMRLTLRLSNDARDTEQLYRVMCFNVFAGNCDDHSRNFSYLYDEGMGEWHLSPAYDLTRNAGFMGEHSTLVNGKGSEIDVSDLVHVGTLGGLSARACGTIADEVRSVVAQRLEKRRDI